MSEETKKILPVIFLIAAIGLGWLSWQGYQDILVIQDQIKKAEDKILDLNLAAEKTNKFISFVKANPEIPKRINILLPDTGSKPSMFTFLANSAQSNALLLSSINFSDPAEAAPVFTEGGGQAASQVTAQAKPLAQTISLSFSGTYLSLKNFLNFAEKSLKLMDVTSIGFGSASSGSEGEKSQIATYSFTVGLKTYYMPQNSNINEDSKISIAKNIIDLSFTKEKLFADLVPPQNYNIDTIDTGDWGNKNIF